MLDITKIVYLQTDDIHAQTGYSDPVKANDNLVLWFTNSVKINKEEGI